MIPTIYEVAMDDLDTPGRLTPAAFCDLYERVTGRYDRFVEQSDLVVDLSQTVWDSMSVSPEHLRREIGGWFTHFVTHREMRVDAFLWTLQSVMPMQVGMVDVLPSMAGRLVSAVSEMLPTIDDWQEFQAQIIDDPCPARLRRWLGDRVYGRPLTENEQPAARVLALMCRRFGQVPIKQDGTPISYERISE